MSCSENWQVLHSLCEELWSFRWRIMAYLPSTPWILTPFNYLDWREDMQLSLCNLGYYRIILRREVDPHRPVERNKFQNLLDEAFSDLCTHISIYLIFHLEGLRTPRKSWETLEDLFWKKYELQGHLLENELVALHLNDFETIEQFFTRFKSLALQCR